MKDMYVMYSVNSGTETRKILRDQKNFEPLDIIEKMIKGKFTDDKVTRGIEYMLQNNIKNYL